MTRRPLEAWGCKRRYMAQNLAQLALGLLVLIAACSNPEPSPAAAPEPAPSLEALVAALSPYSPESSTRPLKELSARLSREDNVAARAVYLRVCVDFMLLAMALQATGANDEAQGWWNALEAATWRRANRDAPGRDGDPVARYAAAIRAIGRPLLKNPEQAADARVSMAILDAILGLRVQDSRPMLGLRELVRRGRDRRGRAALLLAISAFPLLDGPEGSSRVVTGAHGGSVTGVCEDGRPEGLAGEESVQSFRQLRQWCGFACTQAVGIGPAARPPAPLTPAIHQTCLAELWGLDAPDTSRVLSADTFLGARFLEELLVLSAALEVLKTGELSPAIEPFVAAFEKTCKSVIVTGGLPFLSAAGPSACDDVLELPRMAQAWNPLRLTPTILVSSCGEIRLAQWPRMRLSSEAVTLINPEAAFPGEKVASREPTPLDRKHLLAASQGVSETGWPEATDVRAITLVLPASSVGSDLTRMVELARAGGFTSANLLLWPDHQAQGARFPSPSQVSFRLDPAPQFSPAVHVTSHSATFRDARGREIAVPMFGLHKYLPDVYATVETYAQANPAVEGLVVSFDPRLDLQSIVDLLVALEVRRTGNVTESTEALMASPPATDGQGAQSLMGPLFVGG